MVHENIAKTAGYHQQLDLWVKDRCGGENRAASALTGPLLAANANKPANLLKVNRNMLQK